MASRKQKNTFSISDFHVDPEMRRPARIAAFLHWYAQHQPYVWAGYNEVLQATNGLGYKPRLSNDEVRVIKGAMHRAGQILMETYGRAVISNRGLGIRATVDAADTVRHVATKRAKRAERAIVSLAQVDEIVDVSAIPNTPENKALKQWYQRDVRGILKQVSDAEFLTKMLPPAPPEATAPTDTKL